MDMRPGERLAVEVVVALLALALVLYIAASTAGLILTGRDLIPRPHVHQLDAR
jgi:hypothetical protein